MHKHFLCHFPQTLALLLEILNVTEDLMSVKSAQLGLNYSVSVLFYIWCTHTPYAQKEPAWLNKPQEVSTGKTMQMAENCPWVIRNLDQKYPSKCYITTVMGNRDKTEFIGSSVLH